MTRLTTILLLLLIGCALSVVTSQHQARKLFVELQAEQDVERKLDNEWRELQIESQTQGNGKRIEQKASRELGMRVPDAKKTVIVVLNADTPATTEPKAAAHGLGVGKSDQAAPSSRPGATPVVVLPKEKVRNDAR